MVGDAVVERYEVLSKALVDLRCLVKGGMRGTEADDADADAERVALASVAAGAYALVASASAVALVVGAGAVGDDAVVKSAPGNGAKV